MWCASNRKRRAQFLVAPAGRASRMSDCLVTDGGATAGYLRVGRHDFALYISPPGGAGGARLHGCPRLRTALAGHEVAVLRRLQHATSVGGFVGELREVLERQLAADALAGSLTPALPPAAFYEQLIAEVNGIGWASLCGLSPSLDELQLTIDDTARRAHVLTLSLPPDYPARSPVARAALPAPFELRWAPGERPSLAAAAAQFRGALAAHQSLWDELDDLDREAWVLEPKHPTRDVCHRRLALGGHCSLLVTLHPTAPSSLPELRFLGAERSIAPLRRALNSRLAEWRPERRVRLNLQALLGLALPSPVAADAADAADYSVECAICYEYLLDGEPPNVACDGCAKPFHQACLAEWLQALPSTQQSFNRLFGECVYCSKPISIEAVR